MPTDPRKRQKQLAKKAAKRKATVAGKKQAGAFSGAGNVTRHLAAAAQSPLHECLMGQELFDTGLGTVIVSRAMPGGKIGAAFFLLDVFCLGIKNADVMAESQAAYQWRLERVAQHEHLIAVAPAYARKLVEDTEAYARDLGFPPHPDYQLARRIFGDIDATACSTRFVFGKDGKPFYIVGPHDSPRRGAQILDTLSRRCGPGGFDYLIPGEDIDALDEAEDEVIEAEYRRLP